MSGVDNTMRVAAVEPEAWLPELPALAVGEPVIALVSADEPPVFAAEQEPVADGVAHPTTDGIAYYRPDLRVVDRAAGLVAGPDVWFLRDAQGGLRLEWTLAEVAPPGLDEQARPFPMALDSALITWHGGHLAVDPGGLAPVDDASAAATGGPRRLHGGLPLLSDQAKALELAMSDPSSGCRLEIGYTYDYLLVSPGNGQYEYYQAAMGFLPGDLELDGEPTAETILAALERIGLGADRRKAQGFDEDEFLQSLPRREPRRQSVTVTVPFVFHPHDEANAPIYRALHGVATLSTQWRKSAAGWVRDSGFPNTVYRLPDELRLAFDPGLGTPHVITTLHNDGEGGAAGVRVLLRVAPWQDPRRVAQVRELVGARAAQVMVGPVVGATLRLGGSFPEAIRVLGAGADGVAFSLADGVDLLLELSLEYFQLLCGMIGSAVGLPGQAEITLSDGDATAGEPGATVTVPVNLRMDTVNDLPVGVDIPGGAGPSPTTVRITNQARTAIRIGGCTAAFVRRSDTSVVPLGASPARCTSTFPIELAADATAELTFDAVDPQPEDWWNAILVDLLDKAMVDDARTTLLRANELAGTGQLTWAVRVSCPVFAVSPSPARWSALAAIEVEVSAAGFDTTTIVLQPGTPAVTVTMRQPLSQLIAGSAGGIHTVGYRVRNNYVDHQGQWTQPQQQSGDQLIVYPNAAQSD